MWQTDSLWFETAVVLGIFAVGNIHHLWWLPKHGVNGWTGEPRTGICR